MTYLWVSLALTAVFAILYWVRNYNVAKETSVWINFGIRVVLWFGIMWLINWYATPTLAFNRFDLYCELLLTLAYSSFDMPNQYRKSLLNLWGFGASWLLALERRQSGWFNCR